MSGVMYGQPPFDPTNSARGIGEVTLYGMSPEYPHDPNMGRALEWIASFPKGGIEDPELVAVRKLLEAEAAIASLPDMNARKRVRDYVASRIAATEAQAR